MQRAQVFTYLVESRHIRPAFPALHTGLHKPFQPPRPPGLPAKHIATTASAPSARLYPVPLLRRALLSPTRRSSQMAPCSNRTPFDPDWRPPADAAHPPAVHRRSLPYSSGSPSHVLLRSGLVREPHLGQPPRRLFSRLRHVAGLPPN